MSEKLKKIGDCLYEMEKKGAMLVPGLIVASEELLKELDIERPLIQVENVATLAGIIGHSIAMPDIHWGYGFAIGAVAAMDSEHGVISPGGVGYDINCGVRVAVAPLHLKELSLDIQEKLLQAIYEEVPSGVGQGHRKSTLSLKDLDQILEKGAQWAVQRDMAFQEDLENIESRGCIKDADNSFVSDHAKERGHNQLGSIGSGNHFVEIGEIEKIFCQDTAKRWGIEKGQLSILIHSGSRGLGHQVCQDTLNKFIRLGYGAGLVDRQLVSAPISSKEGKEYFHAMSAAANFAFANRQVILHGVRKAFQKVLLTEPSSIRLLYDVCHNIAKFETHEVKKKKKTLCIHRKGATRAFGPGHPELPEHFQLTGQPVLVPGDMERASYLLAGLGNPLTFCSCCHGAGRARSRIQSSKTWNKKNPIDYLKKQGISIRANSIRTITEEMPDAYKDVDLVVEAVERARLAKKIARLKPRLVVKG